MGNRINPIIKNTDCYPMPLKNDHNREDESLVNAIKNGDKDSFKELYYKYFHPLIRFALYRTHSLEMSRETVQELFTRIWLKRNLLDPNKSIKAYLYKSLDHIIINNKSLLSSKNVSLEDVKKNAASNTEQDRELAMDIQAAVDGMPEKIKIVFLLSRAEGYKYGEIAEICKISEKAVEKRMSKAFTFLRKKLSEKYFEL